MKKLKFSKTAPGRDELLEALRRCKSARMRDRLRGLIWLREGAPVQEVAMRLDVGRNTPAGWVRRLNAEGIEGLADHSRTGRPSRLTSRQEKLIRNILTDPPALHNVNESEWSPDALAQYLDTNFGVRFSRSALYRMLDELTKTKNRKYS